MRLKNPVSSQSYHSKTWISSESSACIIQTECGEQSSCCGFRLNLKPVGNCSCHIGHAIAVNLFQTQVYFWLLVLAYSEGQFS